MYHKNDHDSLSYVHSHCERQGSAFEGLGPQPLHCLIEQPLLLTLWPESKAPASLSPILGSLAQDSTTSHAIPKS